MVPGTGTAINVVTVLVGSTVGVVLGGRIPPRVINTVTDAVGLVVLLVAALQAAHVLRLAQPDALGRAAVVVVLAASVLGAIVGSLLRLQDRLEALGEIARRALTRSTPAAADDADAAARARFVEGFVLASLVFCVGPLTILGAFADGLSGDIELLVIKSTLDGFTSVAFASALGWGVAASALFVLAYQGTLTLVAATTGSVLSDVLVSSITAVGGLLLVGIALRLLRIREMPVADLLPALVLAPLLTLAVRAFRG